MKDFMSKMDDKSEMGDGDSDAKLSVLQELRDMCRKMMGEKHESKMGMGAPSDMQAVTVAAPDDESLEKGLEMAKGVVPGEEGHEHEFGMGGESDDMELEEIESMIQELEAKKRDKMMKV